jgi:AcrR family transcriptional regulator
VCPHCDYSTRARYDTPEAVLALDGTRRTQADRRARTRDALLEAAARRLSKYGYANLALERVASEAGYTRGALYHLFANKEDLVLAVVKGIEQTWTAEVGALAADHDDPVDALITIARGHAIYCRREVAGVMTALAVEFAGRSIRSAERSRRSLIGWPPTAPAGSTPGASVARSHRGRRP